MLAKEGVSQEEVVAALRDRGVTFDAVAAMSNTEVDTIVVPPAKGPSESACLPPDMTPLIERE